MSFVSKTICAKCSHNKVCSMKNIFKELKNTLCNDYDTDDDDLFEISANCKEFNEVVTVRTTFN